MSVVTENMKHIYQNRTLLYVLFLITILDVYLIKLVPSIYVNKNILISSSWMFALGFLLSSNIKELLAMELSFCIPNYQKEIRKSFFVIVIFGALGWSLFNQISRANMIPLNWMSFITELLFLMLVFWAGAFLVGGKSSLYSFVIVGIVLSLTIKYGVNPYVSNTTFQVITILSGIVVNISVWRNMVSRDLAREFSGIPFFGLGTSNNKRMQNKLKHRMNLGTACKSEILVSPKVEEFFLRKVSDSEYGSIKKSVWGKLYHLYCILKPQYAVLILIILVTALCLICYLFEADKEKKLNPVLIIMLFGNLSLIKPMIYTNNIYEGRNQRFTLALVYIFFHYLLITSIIFVGYIFPLIIQEYMPSINILGKHFDFTSLPIEIIFIPIYSLPAAYNLGIIWEISYFLGVIYSVILLVIVSIIMVLYERGNVNYLYTLCNVITVINLTMFIVLMKWFIGRRDLVKQR